LKRDDIKKELIVPAKRYLDKNYSQDTLIRYLVGDCVKKGKQMSNRTVIPIFDNDNKWMIGCTGRSIFPKCDKCKKHHFGDDCKYGVSKWKHSIGLKTTQYLFNYWFAK